MPFSRQGAQGARLSNVPGAYVPGVVLIDGNGAASCVPTGDLVAGLPDMIVTDITWTPASPVVEDQVVFSAVVQNVGVGPTPDGTICDCLFTIQQGGVQVARTWEDDQDTAIGAGVSVTMTANGSPTAGVNYWVATAGTYQVVALTNGNNRFIEISITNNTLTETFTVAAAPPGTPSAPVLNAVAGNGTVALSWNAPANNGSTITSYRLRRDGVILNPPDTTTTALVYTDNAVTNNVAYSYTVAAVNAVGEGPPSAPVVATPFTGGAIPALLPTILDAVPANKLFALGGANGNFGAYDTFLSTYGISGVGTIPIDHYLHPTLENMGAYFYFPGSDVTAVVDPHAIPASYLDHFANHHSWMGYQTPTTDGGTFGQPYNAGVGIHNYKIAHPNYLWVVQYYMRQQNVPDDPTLGDYYNDALWTGYARTMSNLAAGLKAVGADGMWLNNEFSEKWGPLQYIPNTSNLYTSANKPASPVVGYLLTESDTGLTKRWTGTTWETRTIAELKVKVEARGFQFGQAIFNNFPNCKILTYEWHISGGPYQSAFFAAQGNAYPSPYKLQDDFYYGIMRAMQVANGANSFFWDWLDEYYSGAVHSAASQRGIANAMAIMSQRMAPAVRDFMMQRFAMMLTSWAPGITPYNVWPQLTEPLYTQLVTEYRKRSGGGTGWRSEYLFPDNMNNGTNGPGWMTGSPLQSGFSDSRANPPGGHKPGLQAAMSATTQDSTPITVGPIGQSRAFNTVTLTFTAAHTIFGIRNVHWTLYAANGSTITAQAEAVMVLNENGGTINTNFDNAFMACTATIPNATAGLYVNIDVYSTVGQRTSRSVQLV